MKSHKRVTLKNYLLETLVNKPSRVGGGKEGNVCEKKTAGAAGERGVRSDGQLENRGA